MKEIIKSKTDNVLVYQALDGTEFKSKEECTKYEESAKCVLFYKYNKLVVKSVCEETIFKTGCCDDIIDIVKINAQSDKAQSDIDLIMQIFFYFNHNPDDTRIKRVENLCKEAIGNFLFIHRGYDNENFWIMDSLHGYKNHLDNICNATN